MELVKLTWTGHVDGLEGSGPLLKTLCPGIGTDYCEITKGFSVFK